MRERKYKAWDLDRKKWVDPAEFFIDGNGKVTAYQSGGFNYEIVEFTGLHDRHGKEIYEGDVVYECINIDTYDYRKAIVKYDEELAAFGTTDYLALENIEKATIMPFAMIKPQYKKLFEIIGNIYEHPELLNGESEDGK